MSIVYDAAHACLMESDPARKAACVRRLQQDFAAGLPSAGQGARPSPSPTQAVPPGPSWSIAGSWPTPSGTLSSMPATSAWTRSTASRPPPGFYADWIRVAVEEAYHFELLRAYLTDQGRDYGDDPAHDGPWEMVRNDAAFF